MKLKWGRILGTAVAVCAVTAGIAYYAGRHGSNIPSKEQKEITTATPSKDLADISSLKQEKITTEKKSVNVNFIYNDQKVMSAKADLYSITKRNDKPIKIQADGDLLKSMVEDLSLPSVSEENQKKAEVTKFNGLQKLIDGEPIIGVDKEKTLNELEKIARTNPENDTFDVSVYTKTYDDGGSGKLMNDMGFKTLIASFTTTHPGHIDDANRNVNLSIASKKINGVILKPGERFSFNRVVGNRTKANGFKDAGVISQGKVIPGIGGGICQVSTTLYRAVMMAGLQKIERHNHSIYDGIEYAERGLDAAVAWGYKDFVFKNSLKMPVLIKSQAGDGWVSVQIYAEKQPFDKVELVTRNEVKLPYETQITRNPNLTPGTVKILHPGVDGYSVEAYRIITQNGETREERLSKDRYLTFNRREEVNR